MRVHHAARVLVLAGALVAGATVPAGAAGPPPTTQLVSLQPDGSPFPQGSRYFATPSVSGDGRLVAFLGSDNLVYVRDGVAGTTVLAGLDDGGHRVPGYAAVLSSDGSTLAWATLGGAAWVRDLRHGQVRRVAGLGELALSGDGRVLSGTRRRAGLQVVVVDVASGHEELVSAGPSGSPGRGDSSGPSLSADGRLVAFTSSATDLPEADPIAGRADVFVVDRRTHLTQRLTGRARTATFPFRARLSGDGSTLALLAHRSGAPMWMALDRGTGRVQRIDVSSAGVPANAFGQMPPALSYDGSVIAFESYASNLVPDDTNGTSDVFVRDVRRGTTTRASVAPGGTHGLSSGQALSADGRTAAFFCLEDLVPGDTNHDADVYVRAPLPG